MKANVERYQLLGLCTLNGVTTLRLREEIRTAITEQVKGPPTKVIQGTVET